MITKDTVKGLVVSVLAKSFDNPTKPAPFHEEMWELFCSHHKYIAVAAPRAHAKTSAGTFAYGLTALLFRDKKFLVIVSDTEGQAVLFLNMLRYELQNNPDIKELFHLKLNEKKEVQFLKDSDTDIVVEFEDGYCFRVIAKGAEQKLRGLIWNGTRPDLILCDDMENDEMVVSKERREKLRRWFNAALLPCLSDNGVVRMVGTILHMDSLLERLMPKIHSKNTREVGLKVYSLAKTSGWKAVKYRAHNEDFTELLWPEKKTAEFFKAERARFAEQGLLDIYSQEFLNIPIDESTTFFKRKDFLPISEEELKQIRENKKHLNFYVTADLAISESEKADYTVFLIAGMDENKIIYLLEIVRERMDGKEIVDEIIDIHSAYKPEIFGIEDMQVTKSIGPFLKEEMLNRNQFPNILKLKTGNKDKVSRAKSIQARMRIGGVKFNTNSEWFPEFQEELMKFPRDRHDDQVDAFAYLGLLLDKMTQGMSAEEIEEQEYEEDVRKSRDFSGRSATTGY